MSRCCFLSGLLQWTGNPVRSVSGGITQAMSNGTTYLAAGTKVRVAQPMEVPEWSDWDDDKGRTSTPVKKRLQTMFFKGDKKVGAEIVYIAKETDRDKLRKLGRVKVRLRDASGASVIITAESEKLTKAI